MSKILVIDDERSIRNTLREILEYEKFEVDDASDGIEGMNLISAGKYDVILCDIKMPKKDGFEFLQEIRSSRKWVPIIIVSAMSEHASMMKGYHFDADWYITKPINLEDTLKALKIMLSLAPLRKK